MPSSDERREALEAVCRQAGDCTRCPQLAATRTTVVFGSGNADADVMFVGEAPGTAEDAHGVPLTGRPGALLDEVLGEIGLARQDVFVTNAVLCRPPQNRAPTPGELDNCREYLWRALELVEPTVVCTLGNVATRLLREDPAPVTALHGCAEVRTIGPRTVRLLPLLDPAAALYQDATVELLREDARRIPSLVALGPPKQPAAEPAPAPEDQPPEQPAGERQLGLF